MPFVGIRELSRNVSQTLDKLSEDRLPVIVTNHGRPVAALVAVDQNNLEDLVLAATPEAVRRRQKAEEAVLAGQGTVLNDSPDDEPVDTSSRDAIVEWLRPTYAKVLGREPSEPLLAAAAGYVGTTVGDVLQTIHSQGEDQAELAQRVGELNTNLYRRLWAHNLNGVVRARLDEIGREPNADIGAVIDDDVVQNTIQHAAYQLRRINEPLVDRGDLSLGLYEACLRTVASFDDLAHHDHAPPAVIAEAVA